MGETSKDVLTLLNQLMPGFLTAWVVYGLTTYTKPPQFERVIQAVTYSFLVNVVVAILEWTLLFAGKTVRFGLWDKSSELVASTANQTSRSTNSTMAVIRASRVAVR